MTVDYNIYSHFIVKNKNENSGHRTLYLYPKYPKEKILQEKGVFYLSLSRNNLLDNMIKKDVDVAFINDKTQVVKFGFNPLTTLKLFRLNDDKLEAVNGNDVYSSLSFTDGKLSENYVQNFVLYKFDYSKSGSEINIIFNNPTQIFYKINYKRDLFYLTQDIEKTKYVKINDGIVTDKNEASIFSYYPVYNIDEINRRDAIIIPKEQINMNNKVVNEEEINEKKLLKQIYDKSNKYNLVQYADGKKIPLKFYYDNHRKINVFTPLSDMTNTYELIVWIKEL